MVNVLSAGHNMSRTGALRIRSAKLLMIIVFLSLSISGYSTVYYVSSSTGSDENSGTSEALAWKSLSRVNYFFKLEPGDQILFKRGDEWVGTLQVNGSGTSENPIVYGAYGTGDKPKFYGSEVISEWTKHSGNIYKSIVNRRVHQVFVDGRRMQLARYPSTGQLKISSVGSSTQFSASGVDGLIDYTGATWVGRTQKWRMIHKEIVSFNGSTFTLESAPLYNLNKGEGFFFINKLDFLTVPGQWYYDESKSLVYLWTPNGDSPDNYEVKGSVIDYGFNMVNNNYVTIRDLDISQYSKTAINTDFCDHVTIENSRISFCSSRAVVMEHATYTQLKGNVVAGNVGGGFWISSPNSIIENNSISDVCNYDEIGLSELGVPAGIWMEGDNSQIRYNRIENIGFNGIHWKASNTIIENNFIDNCNLTLTDGGGIYTYTGQSLNTDTRGSVVRNNIIVNCNTDDYMWDGTNNVSSIGIYLDEGTSGVKVTGNTTENCGNGIFLNQTSDNLIDGNTIYDSGIGFLIVGKSGYLKSTFTNNLVGTVDRTWTTNWWENQYERLVLHHRTASVDYDYNTYVSRYATSWVFQGYSDFTAWKAEHKESNSKYIGSPLSPGETEQLFYNDTKQNKTFNLGTAVFKDIYGNEVTGKLILEPFTSKILIGKDFSGINQNPVILDQSFNISSPVLRDDVIGNVVASDPDSGQVVRYSIINGEETDWLSIDSISGEIYANTVFQMSSDISFEFLVQAKDDAEFGLTDTATIVVYVKGEPLLKPQITSFVVPDVVMRLTIPVNSFVAESSNGIAGYLLTETSQEPSLEDAGWTSVSPEEYTFSSAGTYKLYAWVKDSAGNISEPFVVTVTVILPDLSPVSSEYLFEEGAGNDVIDSEGSNDGILVNEAVRTSGASGMGLQFSGSGHVSLGECFGENVQEEVTMSAWLKPAASSSGYQGIVMHGGPNTDSYALYIYPNTKTIGFKTSGTTSSWFSAGGVEELWDGNWHHVAVTYNGSEKVIYVDNVAVATISATGSIDSGYGYNLLIGAGRDEEVPTLLYEGMLDEVRIYNYALTASAIGDLYHPVNRELNKIATVEEVTICEGSEYMGWTEAGEYERTLQRVLASASGADSVVTTTLYVTPGYTVTETATVCEGEIYTFGGQTLIESGEYTEVFSAQSGCDSTVVLTLTVNPVYNIVEDITIAEEGNYKGWDTEGTYTRILESIGGCDSIVTTNLSIEQKVTQFIELKKGWNIFSSYVIPNNKNMESVTEKLRMEGNLVRVQDESGNTYEEWSSTEGWSNKIGNLLETEGYKILVHSPSVLKVEGKKVAFPLEIKLKKGMNVIPFPFEGETDAANVFQPLIDAQILEKVQDESGRSLEYWKSIGWLNGIGSLIPGEGYIVHVSDDGNIWFNQAPVKSAYIYAANSEPVFFSVDYEDNGFAHMNINVIGLNESGLSVGDEVAIYDNTVCVGAVKLAEWNFELNVVSIPASSSDNFMEAGFDEGNPIIFKVWKGWKNETVQFSPSVIDGELEFSRYASLFVSFENLISLSEDIEIYPNPANNIVFVRFPALPEEGAQISLLDLSGKELSKHIVSSNLEKLNVESFPAGLYFLKVSVRNRTSMHKLVIA